MMMVDHIIFVIVQELAGCSIQVTTPSTAQKYPPVFFYIHNLVETIQHKLYSFSAGVLWPTNDQMFQYLTPSIILLTFHMKCELHKLFNALVKEIRFYQILRKYDFKKSRKTIEAQVKRFCLIKRILQRP